MTPRPYRPRRFFLKTPISLSVSTSADVNAIIYFHSPHACTYSLRWFQLNGACDVQVGSYLAECVKGARRGPKSLARHRIEPQLGTLSTTQYEPRLYIHRKKCDTTRSRMAYLPVASTRKHAPPRETREIRLISSCLSTANPTCGSQFFSRRCSVSRVRLYRSSPRSNEMARACDADSVGVKSFIDRLRG